MSKQFFAKFLMVFVSLLISLVIAESFLRFGYAPEFLSAYMEMQNSRNGSDQSWQFDLDRFAFEPNQTIEVGHAEYEHLARIDEQGWRNPCFVTQSRRLLVGDSFVFGIGLADDETLQCNLSEHGTPMYSAGVPGANAHEYLSIIEKNAGRLQETGNLDSSPELVLAIFVGNDFESLLDFSSKKPEVRPDTLTESANELNKIIVLNPVFQRSYLIQLVKLVLGPKIKRMLGTVSENVVQVGSGSTLYRRGTETQKFVVRLDAFFEALRARSDAAGLGTITLLLLPDVNEISSDRRKLALALQGVSADFSDPEFKRSVLRETASRHGLGVIDGYDCLPQSDWYYIHDNHFRPLGSDKMAACIAAHYRSRSPEP